MYFLYSILLYMHLPFLLHASANITVKLQRCNRYPPSWTKRLSFPRISFTLTLLSSHAPLSHCLSLLIRLSYSLSSGRSVLPGQEKAYAQHCADPELRRSGNCVSSLRSSAIPLTAAHVSNVCRGMNDGSFGYGRARGREEGCNVARIKGRITGN